MDEKEYWAAIDRVAEDFSEAVSNGEIDSTDAGHDWLNEYLDCHEYVIYTWKAVCVGVHTSNRNAILDQGLDDGSLVKDGRINYELVAYFAMQADATDRIDWDKIQEVRESLRKHPNLP